MNFSNYFQSLEAKFIDISKYAYPNEDNYNVYSTEIALLFMAACSEFEVVSKHLCILLNPGSNPYGMKAIAKVFQNDYKEILSESVQLTGFNCVVHPFDGWTPTVDMEWWTAYNDVKHHRLEKFSSANLGNLISALSALEIVIHHHTWKVSHPSKFKSYALFSMSPQPRVFHLVGLIYDLGLGPTPSDVTFDII